MSRRRYHSRSIVPAFLRRPTCWIFVVVWLSAGPPGTGVRAEDTVQAGKGRYALLVGCTTYATLPESLHLRGPGNDVLLMRDLLTTRFRFPADQVVVLAESQGGDRRPIRANIEREFRHLIDTARDGDEVVILMAGHGSQQPDLDPPGSEDAEPDGFDEIFLPADIGKWNGGTGTIENAIVDDELRGWLSDVRRKGASVWVIMDACHSGTMVRGGDDEVRRELPEDLLVPPEVTREAVARAAERQSAAPAERTRGGSSESPSAFGAATDAEAGLVAVYAAQSNEVTVEKLLPADGTDRKPYGLLTFTINEILTQSAEPLTYEELIRRVRDRYVHLGRTFPTPLVEGRDRRREVLGDREWSGHPIRLKKSDKTWKVDAGAVHGLTRGSILAVGPVAQPAAYVKLSDVRTFDSTVEPCEFEGRSADPQALADGATCELATIDFGDARLRVAVDRADNLGRAVDAADVAAITADLEKLAGEPRARVRAVADVAEAQWLVRHHEGLTYVLPASGVPVPDGSDAEGGSPLQSLFGPAPEDRPLSAWLRDTFEAVARAENLKRLATTAGETARGGKGVKVEIEPRLLASEQDAEGTPVADGGAGLTLHSGDLLTLRVKNPNSFPIDVTLLYVDSGYGISCLFPIDETNRLRPGESLPVGPVEVNAETVGLEHLVAIAVAVPPGEIREPADFSVLAQPSLEAARDLERTRGGPTVLDSPLGELLDSAIFAGGTTRGLSVKKVEEHAMRLTSFRISPDPRADSSN